jgi:peptidoglycan-N-acetylglucosamine deacetylase
LANHALLTGAGLVPRCPWLGTNWRRLPGPGNAVGLTFDDGPDPHTTPAVLDVLAAFDARATFFCVGQKVERHPGLARRIVAAGHAAENHSHRHRLDFSLLGPRRYECELGTAQQAIEAATGERPRLFRAPAGVRNPFLDRELQRQQLQLVSWTRRGFDTVTRSPQMVLQRLLRGIAPGDILLLHDAAGARASDGRPVVLSVLPQLLAMLRSSGLSTVRLRDHIQVAS